MSDVEWDNDTAAPYMPDSPFKSKAKPIGRRGERVLEATERTPLLRKAVSLHIDTRPLRTPAKDDKSVDGNQLNVTPTLVRRSSTVSVHQSPVHHGQSTFGQTVRSSSLVTSYTRTYPWSLALQFNRHPAWDRHAFRATCFCVCWLDLRNASHHLLWVYHLLYVSSSSRRSYVKCVY